jgi:ribosomal protein S27E
MTPLVCSTDRRFACPECGQHYTVDWSWQENSVTCQSCGRIFEPEVQPVDGEQSASPATDPTDSEPARHVAVAPRRIRVYTEGRAARTKGMNPGRLYAIVLGLLTPILLVPAVSLGFLTAILSWIFVLLACPQVAEEASTKLFQTK